MEWMLSLRIPHNLRRRICRQDHSRRPLVSPRRDHPTHHPDGEPDDQNSNKNTDPSEFHVSGCRWPLLKTAAKPSYDPLVDVFGPELRPQKSIRKRQPHLKTQQPSGQQAHRRCSLVMGKSLNTIHAGAQNNLRRMGGSWVAESTAKSSTRIASDSPGEIPVLSISP